MFSMRTGRTVLHGGLAFLTWVGARAVVAFDAPAYTPSIDHCGEHDMGLRYFLSIGLFLLPIHAMAAIDCNAERKPHVLPDEVLQLAPIADELAATGVETRGAGFASLIDHRITVEDAMVRLQRHTCAVAIASSSPPKGSGKGTPLRFDMTQNGKRMTADEFDAWMKAQGVRVVKPTASAAPAPVAAPPPPPPPKKKKR
jgi:hypothetical protein